MPTIKHRLKLRWPYLLAYLCLVLTGVLVAVAPAPAARQLLQGFLPVWIGFFVAGGIFSAYSILRGRWTGEAFGLPLSSTALAVYAIILVMRFFGTLPRTLPMLASAALLFSFALLLLARWLEVLRLLRAAREINDGR